MYFIKCNMLSIIIIIISITSYTNYYKRSLCSRFEITEIFPGGSKVEHMENKFILTILP